ncbi:MAG: hypothetical protein ACPGVK_03250 [Halocynthiibacter sp.]
MEIFKNHVWGPFLIVLFLGACDTPNRKFQGVAPVWVQVDGSTFVVRKKDLDVEVIRMNKEWPPTIARIFPKAEKAVKQATNCEVKSGSMRGDAAQMFAKLKCPKAKKS